MMWLGYVIRTTPSHLGRIIAKRRLVGLTLELRHRAQVVGIGEDRSTCSPQCSHTITSMLAPITTSGEKTSRLSHRDSSIQITLASASGPLPTVPPAPLPTGPRRPISESVGLTTADADSAPAEERPPRR